MKKNHFNRVVFASLIMFVVIRSGTLLHAVIIPAASCSQQDVQAAINLAQDGDAVLVPVGTATWTTRLLIDRKAISVIGAGKGNTVIVDRTGESVGEDPEMSLVMIVSELGKPVRLSGFTFMEINSPCAVHVSGTGREWRIDNCELLNSAFITGIYVIGYTYGVVDHCRFLNSRVGVLKDWDGWNRPSSFGTANAVYVENCESKGEVHSNAIDAGYGSRYVYRYNYIENTYIESHGTNHQPGVFSYEIYNNVLEEKLDGWPVYHYMYLRGGTGVVFNNTALQGDATWGWIRVNQESSCVIPNYPTTCFSYPCPGQIGRTHDYDGDGVQDLDPLYSWNNVYNGQYRGIIHNGNPPLPCVTDYVQEGRDFFNNTPKPRYVPYPYPHPLTLGDYPGQQRALELQAATGGGSVTLSWKAITGAITYSVLRDWQQVVLTTATSWTESPSAGEHVYMVYALEGTGKILAAEGKLAEAGSGVSQTINLVSGWNWISFNVLPADRSLGAVFTAILGEVEQVKSQSQSAVYANGQWLGDLSNMDGIRSGMMYKVKVIAACTLTVTGTRIAAATPIQLNAGWNWIAYFPSSPEFIDQALSSIALGVQQAKSQTQSAIYSGGSWLGDLAQLEPGKGYAILANGPGTLIYPQ